MQDARKTVFISYRRDVSWAFARLIFNDLRRHDFDVFMDVESINAGEFETVILNQIAARAHFISLLAPGSVERFRESGDWLRREIEFAMDLGRNIIPVLVNNFRFKDYEDHFTGKLRHLPDFNAVTLHHEYFDAGMQRLRDRFMQEAPAGRIRPTPEEEESIVAAKLEVVSSEPTPSPSDLRAELHFQLGCHKFEQGDYAGAVLSYTEAIKVNPNYAAAYNNRGVAHFHSGNFQVAIADYTEAIRHSLKPVSAYTNRGNAYAHRGDYDAAIEDYNMALRLNPLYFDAYFNRGIIRAEQGRYEDAVLDYTKAIQLSPRDATVHTHRAYMYFLMADYKQAQAGYQRAIALNPTDRMAIAGLAVTEYTLGDIITAKRLWEQLVAADGRFKNPQWFQDELIWEDDPVAVAKRIIAEL